MQKTHQKSAKVETFETLQGTIQFLRAAYQGGQNKTYHEFS